MPPSPSLRFSPGRDTRKENHKRGRSLEGGLLIREKDDDLALFNEMQDKERDSFLLHSTDDLDDSLSTNLRYFSDFKLGISIPPRGQGSDLLNADGDKNDYDWLLTPPETPLFPSLDDETPPINLSHRGRPRSQPISIARSNTTDKSNRTNRTSASPHRLSPSPRSSNSTLQSRGRPVSAHHSSSTPMLRPTTPSRSPSRSTTPNKPSTPTLRSSTPTPRRMSTGSSVTVASSGRTGVSPVKTSRGNSASPKLRAWQSNIPGFSTDAPPNLRTSLADRPASYVRGSSPASRNGRGLSPASSNGRGLSPVSSNARGLSPASRNGRDSSSKRQSMSPTASRSASSSCSHDRDQFSSQSKGSMASSGDDDIDSLQSFSVSISDRSAVKKIGAYPSSRAQVLSKKPSRILSSSAPKRSFDSALRQMDRRSPQNMFRPLLSSVPSTTFYAGKASSSHRPVISRNSSITTSSNASSEQGTSFAPDFEGIDHDHDHRAKEWGKTPDPDVGDEVFDFDKVDEINEDVGQEFDDENSNTLFEELDCAISEVKAGESENFSINIASAAVASESSCVQDELPEGNFQEKAITCSNCGKTFNIIDSIEDYGDVCADCSEKGGHLPLPAPETSVVTQSSTKDCDLTKENESFVELGHQDELVSEVPGFTSASQVMLVQAAKKDGEGKSLLSDSFLGKTMEEEEKPFLDQQMLGQLADGQNQSTYDSIDQRLQHSTSHPSSKVDVSQGVGISVLLNRSASSKWPVVQGRTFSAINTPLDDLSYVRDSMNSMRSSIGHGSTSTSSSVDLSSSRQTDARVKRQLSCRKADVENSRHGANIKLLSRGSSFSGISNHTHHAMVSDKSTSEENFDISSGKMEYEAVEETLAVTEENVGDEHEPTESYKMMDAPASELLSHTLGVQLMDTSVASISHDDYCISSSNAEEIANERSISDIEVSDVNQGVFSTEEDSMLNTGACGVDIELDPTLDSSNMISQEVNMDHECTPGLENEKTLSLSPQNTVDDLQEPSLPRNSEDISLSASQSSTDFAHGILEESTVTIVGSAGHKPRSLTLEEATDTILFCSSIVHNLAYQAATIGMEKENLLSLEGSRPTVTMLGKSSPDKKDSRGRIGNKRTPRSNKSRQKRVETADVKTSSPKTKTEIKTVGSVPCESDLPNRFDSEKPLKLESKCNCTVM
ncbi:hypothetical protein AQUCO_04000016v1 [Aquilegia coerulea]|uniref:Uncharacterized protein n=1 Tax=Aquilegia coerulea TaxID=218851 RepID=A0A2G5CQT1_AQUCA|nr:hypothetical protein AQUCO_04000016v1 [Aquilegia coerulea]